MSIRLGDVAPDFSADTTAGPITFHDWKSGAWAVLFSHPADFTPVCTTELGRTASLKDEFDKRNVKAIAVSVDGVESHNAWAGDIKDVSGSELNFPIIGDESREVSLAYDMIHPGEGDTSSVRSVFVIDPAKKVRLSMTYPKSTGRNFHEILRVVDALQEADRGECATPVDWQVGDRIIVPPTVSTPDAIAKFDDVEVVYPYLRTARVKADAAGAGAVGCD